MKTENKLIEQSEPEFSIEIEQRAKGLMITQDDDNWVYVEKENCKALALIIYPELSQPELKAVKTAEDSKTTNPILDKNEDGVEFIYWYENGNRFDVIFADGLVSIGRICTKDIGKGMTLSNFNVTNQFSQPKEECVIIETENFREVTTTICPELLEENKKMKEVLKECYGMLSTHPEPTNLLIEKVKLLINPTT